MGFLTGAFSWLTGPIVDAVTKPFTDIFKAYFNKEISEAELREKLVAAMLSAFTQVEVSHADALKSTFASFMAAMQTSRLMKSVWAGVVISQTVVLVWHQAGIPAIVALGWIDRYPSSGSTVEWAYALIGALMGLGPMVFRTGPTSSSGLVESLKNLVSLPKR